MSPKFLVYEGPMAGRPSLKGAKIRIRSDDGEYTFTGKVTAEGEKGITLNSEEAGELLLSHTFNYELLEDPPS